jgi:integrase
MPLKLVPPRKGKTPNWSIRGTYLKVYVDQSCGTDRKPLARRIMRELAGRIERGEFPEKPQRPAGETFLGAAVAYMEAGRERDHMARLINYFGETPIAAIDQVAVDKAAIEILPDVTPATRNRKVYTPISAVLRHQGLAIALRRPKGAKGRQVTDFLTPGDATAVIEAADSFDREFGLFLRFLLYTGVRLGEALALRWEDTEIEDGFARIRTSKNGDPRPLRLRDDLRDLLIAHRGEVAFGRVFRFHKGGGLKEKLVRAKLVAQGLAVPKRVKGASRRYPPHRLSWVNFHTFRHTWATWMRRYSGLDEIGLMATGNWRDPRSARRYAHAVARDEWNRVDDLPSIGGGVVERERSRG